MRALTPLLLLGACGDDLTLRSITLRTGDAALTAVDTRGDDSWTLLPPNASVEIDTEPTWRVVTV